MNRLCLTLAALAAAASLSAGGGKEKPSPNLEYAVSWEAAVEEARALNLPIVVHRHGFY
jgi:hypothetical protein